MENPFKELSSVNPQRHDRHRRINSDVFRELICVDITRAGLKVVLCIIDHTWGYNKNSDSLAISVIASETRLSERTVRKAIKTLRSMRIIHYEPSGTVVRGQRLNEFLFNKHFDTWQPRPLSGSSPLSNSSPLNPRAVTTEQTGTSLLSGSSPTIERKKDRKGKGKVASKKEGLSSEHAQAVAYFCEKYKHRFSESYHFREGKDGDLISRLLETYDLNKLKRMIDALFTTDDEFIRKTDRGIGILCSQANKLAQSTPAPGSGLAVAR